MKSPHFDTFTAARALEAAGVERAQAEAIASAIGHMGNHATKDDVSMPKSDVSNLEARIDARFATLESRMYRALWIQGGAIVAIVTGLKLLA